MATQKPPLWMWGAIISPFLAMLFYFVWSAIFEDSSMWALAGVMTLTLGLGTFLLYGDLWGDSYVGGVSKSFDFKLDDD